MKRINISFLLMIVSQVVFSQWTVLNPLSSGTALSAVKFTDTNIGYAVGNNGKILKTTNGGVNWSQQISGTTNNISSVFFSDANNGFAVGNSGTILKTTDGGSNWVLQTSGITNEIRSVFFTDINTGYAVGGAGKI
jgi:photosystem II stability/assembly factor-like uncharacterized protein